MIDEFESKVRECIAKAEQMFDVKMGEVVISFKLRGMTAGYAQRKGQTLYLWFNREAIADYWDHMTGSTIPHEVAHLVGEAAQMNGTTHRWAKLIHAHNYYWEQAAILLGDMERGARTHDLPLKSAKQMNEYVYVDPDLKTEIKVSAVVHNRIQQGAYYTFRSTGRQLKPEYCKGSSRWADVKINL